MAASNPTDRRVYAQQAALARWSKEDPKVQAQRGQAGLLEKFRRQVIAEQGPIVEPELTRRAECLRRLHMSRMAHDRERARKAGAS